MKFIPYASIDDNKSVIAVDCYHPEAYTLSHWKGARIKEEYKDDTSTGIVLRALEKGFEYEQYQYVTNNHFDIDGFLGIWSLINPELAVNHSKLLRVSAYLGDFREFDPKDELHDQALKLCCWINTIERRLFYPPFGATLTKEKEAEICVAKYHYFIEKFGDVLTDCEKFKLDWEQEYRLVKKGVELIRNQGKLMDYPNIKLHVVKSPKPLLHYYALFHASGNADMVLSMYNENKYELEYKYTSWVDTYNRKSFPRLDLKPLADRLNKIEKSDQRWDTHKITDTAPVLRLYGKKMNKVERYDHPMYRPIFSSSIPPDQFLEVVIDFFEDKLANAEQKADYSWEEVRRFNKEIEQSSGITF